MKMKIIPIVLVLITIIITLVCYKAYYNKRVSVKQIESPLNIVKHVPIATSSHYIQKDYVAKQKPVATSTQITDVFSGILHEVNTGCFVDAECFVMVGENRITVAVGRRREEVGSIKGVNGIDELESYKGQEVEVYAKRESEGVYSLYGDSSFYIKIK